MLEIKPVTRYSVPKYPQGVYSECPDFISLATPRGAMTAAVLALLLESSCGGGQTGPPPLPPDMITESEARTVIDQVFANAGIDLVNDYQLRLETQPGDTADLSIDGYNDSLEVGYEYLYQYDWDTFIPDVRATLDSLADDSGPYVKAIDEKPAGSNAVLRAIAQEFIDSLRASGAI
jgi:hypothetical protein